MHIRPSSVQNKIKIVFASYSSKAQNTTCAIGLLGYKYFVHFSVWTKCLSDGVVNDNTSFSRTSQMILTWCSKNLLHNLLFRMKRGSTTSILSQAEVTAVKSSHVTDVITATLQSFVISVGLLMSLAWVDQSKMVEVRIMKYSLTILVYLHSCRHCCLSNMWNHWKFSKNSNLQQIMVI